MENCHSEDEVRRISISWLAGAKPCDSSLRSERQTLCHTALDAVSQEFSLSSTTFPASSTEGRRSSLLNSNRLDSQGFALRMTIKSFQLFIFLTTHLIKLLRCRVKHGMTESDPSPLLFTTVFQAGLETPNLSHLRGRGRSCACTSKLQMRGEGLLLNL